MSKAAEVNKTVGTPEMTKARGRLMSAEDIKQEIFRDEVSDWWVRKNVAPDQKIRLGHSTCRWWEADVLSWIDSRRGFAA